MLCLAVATALLTTQTRPAYIDLPPGSLISITKEPVVLPLKSTSVKADISGFGARVTVVQTFTNPTSQPIEAVYTFPLPAEGAVDRMRMKVGERIVEGVIKRREEARLIYEAAKNNGQAAALLDQERPNIFTQSVANILPKATVQIEISYVQLIKFEEGVFEFNFPMVVGPRYLGNAPDPSKISPPIVAKGTRTGANISLDVNLDTGGDLTNVQSVLHEVRVDAYAPGKARVTLSKKDEIPNRDFILRYGASKGTVQSAFLAKYDPVKGGFFSLVLLPPQAPTQQQIAPKEVIFVMDQSGSQGGFPIEKSKELTLKLMKKLNPGDTFNVMGFSNSVNLLWPSPRELNATTLSEAETFVRKLEANGGTQLRAAVEAALTPAPDPRRVRLVVFNTDGYVGDEAEILKSIREHRGHARMFTFGIGSGVNRYLIDSMSEEGKGDSEIVTLAEQADPAVERFVRRTQNPILTDVSATFEGVDCSDLLPEAIPDVFSEKPIVVYGRYAAPGRGRLTLRGTMAGQPWSQTIDLLFPSDKPGGESIPTIWARRKVDQLTRQYSLGSRRAENPMEGQTKIVDLALEYGIMTQYTSFVAVEQRVINIGGKQRKVHVPVEMTEGVSYEGIYGSDRRASGSPALGLFRGGGSGGFAGGAVAANAPASPSAKAVEADRPGSNYLGFNSASNDFYVGEKELAKEKPEVQKGVREQRRKFLVDLKVAKGLRESKGTLEVQVWLTNVDAATMAKLKSLGLVVESQAKDLKLVFGRCNAAALERLAQDKSVRRIEPLG